MIGDLVDDLDEIYCDVEIVGKKNEAKKETNIDDSRSVKSKKTESGKDKRKAEEKEDKEDSPVESESVKS